MIIVSENNNYTLWLLIISRTINYSIRNWSFKIQLLKILKIKLLSKIYIHISKKKLLETGEIK